MNQFIIVVQNNFLQGPKQICFPHRWKLKGTITLANEGVTPPSPGPPKKGAPPQDGV